MKRNIEQNKYEKPSMRLFSINVKNVMCLSGEPKVDDPENQGEEEFLL